MAKDAIPKQKRRDPKFDEDLRENPGIGASKGAYAMHSDPDDLEDLEGLYCYDDEDPDEVLEIMAEIQVRRMPVVNHDKRLVGIISIGDLAKDEDRERGHALGEIARPSGLHSQ